jgi:ABC-type multidrug transport system ATPase subunit
VSDLPAISVNGVSKTYGPVQALRRIQFDFAPADSITTSSKSGQGAILCFWGANGAGKSTLLSIIGGLTRPETGTVNVFGQNPASREFRQTFRPGFLLQSSLFYGDLTIRQNLDLASSLYQASLELRIRLVEQFGIRHILDRTVRDCSPGMIKRASVVRALIGDPRLVVFDEPFASLDVDAQNEIAEVISELKAAGKLVLLATHKLEAVEALADTVVVLDRGTIVDLVNLGESKSQLPSAVSRVLGAAKVTGCESAGLPGKGGER